MNSQGKTNSHLYTTTVFLVYKGYSAPYNAQYNYCAAQCHAIAKVTWHNTRHHYCN